MTLKLGEWSPSSLVHAFFRFFEPSKKKGYHAMLNEKIKNLVASMSDEEICSEVMCWEFRADLGKRALEKFIKENKVSNFFYHFVYTKKSILS